MVILSVEFVIVLSRRLRYMRDGIADSASRSYYLAQTGSSAKGDWARQPERF